MHLAHSLTSKSTGLMLAHHDHRCIQYVFFRLLLGNTKIRLVFCFACMIFSAAFLYVVNYRFSLQISMLIKLTNQVLLCLNTISTIFLERHNFIDSLK